MQRVSGRDKIRLEEYFAALRESEQELNKSIEWLSKPNQDVEFPVAPSFENGFLATDVDKKRFLENPRADSARHRIRHDLQGLQVRCHTRGQFLYGWPRQ